VHYIESGLDQLDERQSAQAFQLTAVPTRHGMTHGWASAWLSFGIAGVANCPDTLRLWQCLLELKRDRLIGPGRSDRSGRTDGSGAIAKMPTTEY
jgi:hypothetical protein